jgi:hypothetical protein
MAEATRVRTEILFSREQASNLVGLSRAELEAWERTFVGDGHAWPARFGLADLIALSVLREMSQRLGSRTEAFAVGLDQLFRLLSQRSSADGLSTQTALVGRDFGRLLELRSTHVQCSDDEFVLTPLRPIIENLKDKVFS